jgi:hypothetical protein
MRRRHAASWCLVAALATVAGAAPAATVVSGSIQTDTAWRAQDWPFEVAGDLTVSSGATLTLEAGVTVHMRTSASLTVEQGALRVLGTLAQPVVITSIRDQAGATPTPGDWGSLRFLDGTIDAVTLLENSAGKIGGK